MQHLKGKGVVGIFGDDAKVHDASIRTITEKLLELLQRSFPHLTLRIRKSIRKQEIHENLHAIDDRLGIKLFAPGAYIQPDGGLLEVQDKAGKWRVILIGESKHQGNDIQNIADGVRTAAMEKKGQYIMPAGNAIERVHKNIQEMKNFMLGEPTGKEALRLRWRGGESPGWTYEGCDVWFDEWRDAVTHWENTHPNHEVAGLIDALREHLSPQAVALIAAKCQPCYGKGDAGQSAEREVAWFDLHVVGRVHIDQIDALAIEQAVEVFDAPAVAAEQAVVAENPQIATLGDRIVRRLGH